MTDPMAASPSNQSSVATDARNAFRNETVNVVRNGKRNGARMNQNVFETPGNGDDVMAP